MLRGVAISDAQVDGMILRQQEYLEQLKDLNKRREAARAHAVVASRGNVQDQYARLYAELVDDYGANVLRLERVPGKMNPYTGRESLRWSDVTGGSKLPHEEDIERLWPLVLTGEGEVDEAVRKGIYEAGFFNRQSNFYLPTSPQRLIAYEMRKSDKHWQHFLASQVLGAEGTVGRTLQASATMFQRLFATILLSPCIMFRSGTMR